MNNIKELNRTFKLAYGSYREDGSNREFESAPGYHILVRYQQAYTPNTMAGSHWKEEDIKYREAYKHVYSTQRPDMNEDTISITEQVIYREVYADGSVGEWTGHKGLLEE